MTNTTSHGRVELEDEIHAARKRLSDVKQIYDAHLKSLEINDDAPPPAAVLKEATRYFDAIAAIEKLLKRLDGVQAVGNSWEEINFDDARAEVLRRIAVYRDRQKM